MPDLWMCPGEGCPKKNKCYRHRAVPTSLNQAYGETPPNAADGTCDDFLELRGGDRLTDIGAGPEGAKVS
jgi:hypothetical protein